MPYLRPPCYSVSQVIHKQYIVIGILFDVALMHACSDEHLSKYPLQALQPIPLLFWCCWQHYQALQMQSSARPHTAAALNI
jgi:hypothetical protein